MSNVVWAETQEEFEDLVSSTPRVVGLFTAPGWCNPCKQLAPHYDVASEKADATFVAVDVDTAPWSMQDYGIKGVPTVMLFEDGKYSRNLLERTAPKLLAEIA